MVECARDIMILVDIITFLIGIAILALAIYAYFAYQTFSPLVSMNTIFISMAVGAVLLVVACLGCFASRRGHKCLLCIYLLIVTAALAAQIGATIIVANFAGAFGTQSALISSSITNEADKQLNNAILSTYTACCSGCPQPQGCNNAQAYYNFTQGFCFNNNTVLCDSVEVCGVDPNEDNCFKDSTLYPPVQIDKGLCVALESFKNGTNVPVVGPALQGSCGGGSPALYTSNLLNAFSTPVNYIVVGFGVLCAIQAINLLAALFVLACTQDYPRK